MYRSRSVPCPALSAGVWEVGGVLCTVIQGGFPGPDEEGASLKSVTTPLQSTTSLNKTEQNA